RRGAGAEEAHPASRARLHPGQAARRGGRGPLLLDRREEPFGRPLREGEAAALAAGREPVPFAGPRGGARGNRRERVALAGRDGRGKEEAGAGPRRAERARPQRPPAPEGLVALREGRGVRCPGREDPDRRRVHGPAYAGPALFRRAPSGDRGEGEREGGG